MKDHVRYFLVPPEEIGYIGFIVHAYEGLAIVRTLSGRLGVIEMLVAPAMEEELMAVVEDLRREISMEELPAHAVAAMKDLDESVEVWGPGGEE
jgi:hypothetical protein